MALSGVGSSGSGYAALTNPPPFYMNGPGDLQAYANQQVDASNTYLLQLGQASAGLAPPVISPVFPDGPDAPPLATSEAPETSVVVWSAPALPADFTDNLDISDLFFADFDITAPELVFDNAPDAFSEPAPDAPGVNVDYVMPTLQVDLPARPDLLAINIAPFGGMTIPMFNETAPTLNLAAPSIREYTPGAKYTSNLLTALQTALRDRITTGGTGLGPDAEPAIWDRGRERENRGAADAIAGLERMEALGYMLPPGAYVDARLKIITETDAASRGHSREVMIESARLELDNVKHALTTATQLEGQLIDYANAVEQRVFESCRYATEAGVAIYNAGVQAYAARVDAYRGLISAYEARVRAEIAKVDAYRAQVDAENAKAQVNRALVDQYRAEIDAALSSVRVFEARINAIQAQADIERTKVQIYGEQVRGYAAKVSAFSANVEAYRARIQGEATKQEAYGARVNAYRAQVDATGKIIDARVAAYRGKLDGFVARWEGYKAQVQGETGRIQALAAIDGAKAEIYRAQVQGDTSFNEVLTKQWQVAWEQAQGTVRIGVEAARANAELYMTTRSLALDAAKVGAQVSAQLGAAALNTLNWSASYGESRSDGTSQSSSYSTSTNTSSSTSNSFSNSVAHNYNYSV